MKNIYFRIQPEGIVRISSSKITQKRLFELVDEKASWIEQALRKEALTPKITLGEEILYFGEIYPLAYHPDFRVLYEQCQKGDEMQIVRRYQRFYKREATRYLKERLNYFANIMQLQPKEMKLRSMKRQWGNCRSNGIITFNIHLMQVPKECIDYVVIHELAHMVHMNHSKAFHSLVEQYLPQSNTKRIMLKQFSASI